MVPSSWPVALPVSRWAIEEDKVWRDLQAQWSFHGLAISGSLVCLEVAVNAVITHEEDNPNLAVESLLRLGNDINNQVDTPLALDLRGGRNLPIASGTHSSAGSAGTWRIL